MIAFSSWLFVSFASLCQGIIYIIAFVIARDRLRLGFDGPLTDLDGRAWGFHLNATYWLGASNVGPITPIHDER